MNLNVVRTLTMRSKVEGADESASDLARVSRAHTSVADAIAKNERQMQMAVRAQQDFARANQSLTAANDNLARSYTAGNDNVRAVGKSFLDTGSEVLKTAGHLKFAAVAAYALSPAFRAMVNPAVVGALAAIGPAAVSAGATVLSAMSPAFAFMAKIALPILVVVAAWKALNYVVDLGASLLEKYGNAQRNLIAGVDENLNKLTRFQDAGLSAEQVRLATELGARLIEAKRTISEFSKVQFDLTNPALNLQHTWVAIVETIAKAVGWLNNLSTIAASFQISDDLKKMLGPGPASTGQMPGAFEPFGWLKTLIDVLPMIQQMQTAGMVAPSQDAAPAVSQADALTAAYERLRAGMGSTSNFAVRFGTAINDLQNPIKETAKETAKAVQETAKAFDQYDNAVQRVKDQIEQLELQTQGFGKSAEEVLKLKTSHDLLRASMRAGREDTPELRAEIDQLSTRYAKLTTQIRQFNEIRDHAASIGGGFAKDIANGVKPLDAALSAATKLRDIFIDMAAKKIATAALSSVMGEGLGAAAGATTSAAITVGAAESAAVTQIGGATTAAGITIGAGEVGGGALAAGGLAAGTAIAASMLPLLAAVAAAAALVYFWQQSNAKKDAAEKAFWGGITRTADFNQRAVLASLDTNTREGSLAAQEIKFQRERADEMHAGNQAMLALLNAQGVERSALQREWNQKEIDAEREKQAEIVRLAEEAAKVLRERVQSFRDRVFAAANDNTTLGGALAEFERNAQREREEEIAAGGQAINDLEAALASERFNIFKRFNDEALAETKRAEAERAAALNQAARGIVDYLLGLQTGADSPLSSSARLSAAQQAFNATLSLAQGGNLDALNRITRDAETLRTAAQARFGSSTGYQSVYGAIQSQLSALPAVQQSTDPIVNAVLQVVTAVNATTGAVNTTTGAVNSTTGAVNTTGSSSDQLSAAQNALLASQNALAAQQTSYAATQANLLSSINSLTNTFTSVMQSARGEANSNANAIVTYLQSIQGSNLFISQWAPGQNHAMGGWIGGRPHSQGGTTINAELDEFMVRRSSAMAPGMAQVLEHINQFGALPDIMPQHSLPVVPVPASFGGRAGNDNSRLESVIERQTQIIAGLLSRIVALEEQGNEKIDRNTHATLDQTDALNRETRVNIRKQRAA